MMASTVIKKQKSDVIHHRSHMAQMQGSYCKGICRKHKSDTPTWSTSGVVYCRTCEIFLKKSGWFTQKRKKCKCCNHLVRSRPRQSVGKAKFDSKKQGNIEWTDPEDAAAIARQEAREKQNRLMQEQSNSEKKSTPIYKEEKVYGKTYYEFRNFIEKEIKLQANYQLVMLKHLLTHKEAHKGKIAESLAHYNNKDPSDLEQVKEFLNKPVYKVLLKSGFVTVDDTDYQPGGTRTKTIHYMLNGKFDDYQRMALVELLDQKIKEYNTQNGILEFDYDNETFDPLNWRHFKNRSLLQEENTIARLEQEPAKEERGTYYSETHICPKCGKTVRSIPFRPALFRKELAKFFGYRGKRPQSWCRECRSNKNNNIAMEESTIPPVTNPRTATDRLSREASSAARWAMKKSETSAVSAKEYMQSTKQEKIDKIKGKLAELRAKLSAHGSKSSPFIKHPSTVDRMMMVEKIEQSAQLRAKLKSRKSKSSPVRETPKAPKTYRIPEKLPKLPKLTADQKNRIRSGTEYGLPPSTIALDVLGSRRLANIVRIQEYVLSAEYLLQKKSKQKRPLVKQGHRFSTLVKQGHRLKSCPICKKKVCSRLSKSKGWGWHTSKGKLRWEKK